MAYTSTSSVKSTIIEENVLGTTPNAGNRYELPRKTGSSLFGASGNETTSDTIRPGLNANGSRRGAQSVTGSIELNAMNADVVDFLLGCAAGAKFNGNVLKANDAVYSFTRVDELAGGRLEINSGCVVNSFSLTAEALGAVQYSFGVVGLKQATATTLPGNFTSVLVPETALEYQGSDLANVIAAGDTTLRYSNIQLGLESPRNPRYAISYVNADGFSSTTRNVTLTLTYFRDPAKDYNTIFDGSLKPYSFELGAPGSGRRYTVYGTASMPQTQSGDDLMHQVVITAGLNTAEGTGFKIEKIPATPAP